MVSPGVPPCCYGLVLAVCERRGFSLGGLQRLQLQSNGAAVLGLTNQQVELQDTQSQFRLSKVNNWLFNDNIFYIIYYLLWGEGKGCGFWFLDLRAGVEIQKWLQLRHLYHNGTFSCNCDLDTCLQPTVGQFPICLGLRKHGFFPVLLYFPSQSWSLCVCVFSRHLCSAVHILWRWIRRSWSCPLTVLCCCWGKKMRCTTALVCQQV